MKKLFVFTVALMLVVSTAYAADFVPTLLKLSAAPLIQYDFDGSNLEIPVQVTGNTAGVIFCVYTRGKAAEIPNTQNGYLGWHHVNKVDTCIYYSTLTGFNVGNNTITWDGKDQDGGVVPSGDYTYYMWAFDNLGAKNLMSQFLGSGWGFDYTTDVQEVDENGLPMANPLWCRAGTRWAIGGDPKDSMLVESCTIILTEGWGSTGDPLLHPSDFNYFYIATGNADATNCGISKYKWIPGGEAELQTDFGDGGLSELFTSLGGSACCPGVCSDGTYLF